MSFISPVVLTLYANRISFADRDMFARYTAIGVGHDAVQLRRHLHGMVDDCLAADNDDVDDVEDPCVSDVSQNEGNVDDKGDEGDEGDEDSNSSVSDDSVDSDSNAYF